ncbi:arylesterase [Pseudobacteriovorax antillogorgiicola]|uniref:Acyl-CoA thioesterase-1 n=1 Tax=Pseudobacteriovorax antillogorgiicola TaxID=1513793 RepID=A0A1Y6C3J2_9BACT|nr:arylesterase [Pseudobacteriovorax antillogorgiicola]TCS50322.1 acyl-CoA thioesterase-1 [Pseudobacteriovorax antillogorgiicola]SMF34197.1 acyl-CoA thioesterase-1 [Pseudobacteriovorax antillogorgiicola]
MQRFFGSLALILSITLSITSFGKGKILALGDSLTFGYEVEEEHTWPKLLEKKLGVPIINGGTAGATSAFGLPTLRFHLKRYTPDLVIYALGANDGLRGLDPKVTQKNIEEAVKLCQEKGIKLVLLGMKAPPNYGKTFPANFEAIYPTVAKKYDIPLMPFMLENVAGQKKLNQPDGIHPNAEGYKIIAENIYKVVTKHYDPTKHSKPEAGNKELQTRPK